MGPLSLLLLSHTFCTNKHQRFIIKNFKKLNLKTKIDFFKSPSSSFLFTLNSFISLPLDLYKSNNLSSCSKLQVHLVNNKLPIFLAITFFACFYRHFCFLFLSFKSLLKKKSSFSEEDHTLQFYASLTFPHFLIRDSFYLEIFCPQLSLFCAPFSFKRSNV